MKTLNLSLLLGLLTAVAAVLGKDNAVLVLRGGQLFDSVKAELRSITAVIIEGERIRTAVRSGQRLSIPPGEQVIDTRGKFILPGLIDAHAQDLRLSEAQMQECR